MPKINSIQKQSSGGVNFQIGDQSSTILEVEKSNIAGREKLSSGLIEMGKGIDKFNKNMQSLEDDNFFRLTKSLAAKSAMDVEDEIFRDKTLAANGSDMVASAEDRYKERMNKALDGISGSRRNKAEAIWNNQFLPSREKLVTTSRQKWNDSIAKTSETVKTAVQNKLMLDYSEESLVDSDSDMIDMYMNQKENEYITDEARQKLTEIAIIENGETVITGLMLDNKFKEAKTRLLRGDLAPRFSPEKKKSLLQKITAAEAQAMDIRLKELRVADEQRKKNLIKQRQDFFNGVIDRIDRGADSKDIQRDSFIAVGENLLTRQEHQFVNNLADDVNGDSDDKYSFEITSKLLTGEITAQKANDMVMTYVNMKDRKDRLSAKAGMSLMKRIKEIEKSSQGSDFNKKIFDEKFKLGKKVFDTYFGSDDFFVQIRDMQTGGAAIPEEMAKTAGLKEFMDRMAADPSQDPVELAISISKKNGGGYLLLPMDQRTIEGLDGMTATVADVNKAQDKLDKDLEEGTITEDEFKKRTSKLMKLNNFLKAREFK